MKGLQIIKCLCFMDDMSNTGITFTTPENNSEITEWLTTEFGFNPVTDDVQGVIKTDTDYVYCYDELLVNGTLEPFTPNATVMLNGIDSKLYLYEVE